MSEDGGDDSPSRPKRKIKKIMIVSSPSESDSDESIGVAGTRRKRLRVVSDEESSDSSGSWVIGAGARRRRNLPKLRDSDVESDHSGFGSVKSDKPAATTSKSASGFASDSSEGNSDKCSICLLRFTNQEIGTPESCEHIFCLDCITEWSKNVNTCPVDRMTFNSIIVRACAGGRVLRTESVKVVERRPSIDLLVIEDPTVCEVCGSTEDEETMLLCDGCDLGYHMQCLTPPLTEVPIDQWLCPNCDNLLDDIDMSEVEDLFSGIVDMELPLGPRAAPLRLPRNVRRSSRNVTSVDEPSTSSGRRGSVRNTETTTSRQSRNTPRSRSQPTARRRTANTNRRKYTRRRKTKTVVIEYEVEGEGKFPVTKRVTRKLKRRKTRKRQPRTAARRTHVRASVRAKLATQKMGEQSALTQACQASTSIQDLAVRRYRAGIPSLSLMGNPTELDYFSDDEQDVSESATTAVATRPTSSILSAYRQARRKMIAIPSPPHASSAPDILSSILESQTLLHSKNSLVTISVDGNINIKLPTKTQGQQKSKPESKEEKLDLSKGNEATKKVPTYPGQSRGGGGWGGGYRGNYHNNQRDQGANSNFSRGGNYDNNYGSGYQNRQSSNFNNFQNNNMRRDDEFYDNYPRRPHQFPHNDDLYFDRPRRATPVEINRGPNYPSQNYSRSNDQGQSRYSLGSSWQPFASGGGPGPRPDAPILQPRHSFGGFENPVDMRMSQVPPMSSNMNNDSYSDEIDHGQEKPHSQSYDPEPEPQLYEPLPQPPVFNFQKIVEVEKSEDEKSDSGLIIDTEKYDPTEPTHDDDSGEDDKTVSQPAVSPARAGAPSPPPPPPLPAPPLPASSLLAPLAVQTILAGIDTTAINVPSNILDSAVRQVLKEHRNLISSPQESQRNKSDEDSDGDCPNFSIYSATSVHIANNNNSSITDDYAKEQTEDNLEDLVQEDDDSPAPGMTSDLFSDMESTKNDKKSPTKLQNKGIIDNEQKKKTEEEYKEKVSKRCPITTNTRNPIKIKLHTPSLIKRQITLYDDEEASQEAEATEKSEESSEVHEEKTEDHNIVNRSNDVHDSEINDHDTELTDITQPNNVDKEHEKFDSTDSKDDDLSANRENQLGKEDQNQEDEPENIENEQSMDSIRTPEEVQEQKEMSDDENENNSTRSNTQSPRDDRECNKIIENVEKMTESISETEDERSYTPCLDENKSNKDASFEVEKDKGIEGLDTEMISEDEGNEMFSENERPPSEASGRSPSRIPVRESEEGEIAEKKKEVKKADVREEGGKKKKKKDSKKEGKDKVKGKKKGEISFKKLSKSGKERNYRERDKDDKKGDKERRGSGDAEARQKKRKEKRKDLERYDVRTVVTEKRRKLKDPFGRDVSPRARSPSLSRSPSGSPARRSPARRSPARRSPARRSPSPPLVRRSASPIRARRSLSRVCRTPSRGRRSFSRPRRSISRLRRSLSRGRRPSPRARRSPPRRRSPSPAKGRAPRIRRSPSPPRRSPPVRRSLSRRLSPVRTSPVRVRRSPSSVRPSPRRRSPGRRKRRRSASPEPSRRIGKKKKRARSPRRRRRSGTPAAVVAPGARPPSPRTPPEPEPRRPEPEPAPRRRRDVERRRRLRDAPPPSKEVFTSGDNILVSVSFKEQERGEEGERRRKRETRRDRRRRKRTTVAAETEATKPVAIIDLERSPFRELTPSPKNVIVLSDSEPGERSRSRSASESRAAVAAPAPAAAAPAAPAAPAAGGSPAGSARSPDAYDPFEPTRSPSPAPVVALEAAALECPALRPLSPAEKVLALLASTRATEPEPPPEPAEPPPAPRIVLPSPTRAPPKLFPGKPSPIKSNPVKPMQAARPAEPPAGASPYSPGSSDFGELFEPPARRRPQNKHNRKKGNKMQVGVKLDDDNLKILDELPSSAVEMHVKSKFLKKLNRQERVVEEVKLVLKPHYNKKHVTKEEYKEILRRAVPKICHNKTGEINPTKIQALVEAYVKKFRKKHKLGIV